MKHTSPTHERGYFCRPNAVAKRTRASLFALVAAAAGLPLLISAAPGPVTQLLWSVEPSKAFINQPFEQQPVLITADSNGDPSTNNLPASVPVTVSLLSGGTLLGGPLNFDIGTAAGNSNGIVRFSGLEIDTVGSYTLQAVTGTGFSGVFTPTNGLSNCILWLDAADTNTYALNSSNGIATWADKSGTGNNAVWSGGPTAPIPAMEPLLSSTAWGGGRVVSFNGSNFYNISTLAPLVNHTFTIVALDIFSAGTNVSNTGTGGGILIGNDYNNQGVDSTLAFGYRNSTQFTIQFYADDINYTSGGWSPPTPRIWEGILDSSIMQHIYLDGVDVGDRQANSYLTNTAQAHVGQGGGGSDYAGEIAELAVYNTNLTDAQRGSVESYLLNKWEGQFNYTGLSAPFTVSANSGSVVSGIYFSQGPTATIAGNTLTPSVTVTVTNSSGAPISGVSVVMSLLSGAGPLNGTLSQVTGNNGAATFPDLSLDVVGEKQLQAQVPGAATNNSVPFLIGAGPESQLVVLTQPSTTEVAGVPFAVQPVVAIEDGYGNIVTNSTDSIVASDFNGYNIDATTDNAITVAVTNGLAVFSGLYLTNANANEQILFTDNAFFVLSGYIAVTGNGPTSMIVETEPSSVGNIGVPFPTQPVVEVFDVYGNLASNGTSVFVSAAPVTLLGPTNAVTASGVATFGGLYSTNLTNVTLTFTAGAASALSTPITIEGGPATSVLWATQPGSAVAGSPFGQQPVLETADAGGNLSTLDLAATNWVSVVLESGGQLVGGPLLVNIGTSGSNGTVTFQNLQINQATAGAVLAARVLGTQISPTNGLTNCVLWLDAADLSTLTINTNESVTAWADKSGIHNNAASVNTAPLYEKSAALPAFAWGQQNIVAFTNNGYFNVSLAPYLVSNTFTIIAMDVFSGVFPGGGQSIVGNPYDGVDGTLSFGYRNSTQFTIQFYADDVNYTSTGWLPPQGRLWTGILDNTNNWNQHIYLNGVQGAIRQASNPLIAMLQGQIGSGYVGELAEIAIYNTNLTDVQRSNVESYFTAKWTQNSLVPSASFQVYGPNPGLGIVGPTGVSTNGNPASSVTVDLSGIPGRSYRLQASTNLASTNWVAIGTNTSGTNGTIQFVDTGATNYPHRYYRAVSP